MLVSGKIYKCENGYVVTVVKNNLPYYKFSAQSGRALNHEGKVVTCKEVWTEEGIAYHNDCGYNITDVT